MRLSHLIVGLGALIIASGGCANRGGPYPPYFERLNRELRAATPGRDVAVLDLDALDHNVDLIRAQVGSSFALRLVTKSLPSIPLVTYLMERVGTDRLMAFSEPFIAVLLSQLERPADISLGKPIPAVAAGRLLSSHEAAEDVQWLVDDLARLRDYLELAQERGTRLSIQIEIDVGLRRGGAADPDELLRMLQLVADHPAHLRLTGLMGYDGHVPHVPSLFDHEGAVAEAFAETQRLYADFVAAATHRFPELITDDLVFDSGGSRTYYRYDEALKGTPVNEVAMGSGFSSPASFTDLLARGHRTAVHLASPISKRIAPGETPFVDGVQPLLARFDPNMEVTFVLLGGGLPGDTIAPPGLQANPFLGGEVGGIRNLLSNQAILTGSRAVRADEGDFVFYHPWEGDGLVVLDRLWLVRSGRVVGWWPTYRGGS